MTKDESEGVAGPQAVSAPIRKAIVAKRNLGNNISEGNYKSKEPLVSKQARVMCKHAALPVWFSTGSPGDAFCEA
jgi:hypothetical protein